jgi:hypothetical protein
VPRTAGVTWNATRCPRAWLGRRRPGRPAGSHQHQCMTAAVVVRPARCLGGGGAVLVVSRGQRDRQRRGRSGVRVVDRPVQTTRG